MLTLSTNCTWSAIPARGQPLAWSIAMCLAASPATWHVQLCDTGFWIPGLTPGALASCCLPLGTMPQWCGHVPAAAAPQTLGLLPGAQVRSCLDSGGASSPMCTCDGPCSPADPGSAPQDSMWAESASWALHQHPQLWPDPLAAVTMVASPTLDTVPWAPN